MSCRIALAVDQPAIVRMGTVAIAQRRPNEYKMRSKFMYNNTPATMITTAADFMFNIKYMIGRDRKTSSGNHHSRGRHHRLKSSP